CQGTRCPVSRDLQTPMMPDVAAFFRATFGPEPAVVTAAPGRIEFIGNHTDYNGGLVLGAAIDRHVWAALRLHEPGARGGRIRVASTDRDAVVTVPAGALRPLSGEDAWANYVLGVAAEVQALGADLSGGFDIAITSTLP